MHPECQLFGHRGPPARRAFSHRVERGSTNPALSRRWLDAIGVTGFGAVIGLVLIASFINLFIISGSAMWALMAPVTVPTYALIGLEPGSSRRRTGSVTRPPS